MQTINFSVDSALLRELGERLVGRPEIALGELIKNAYDADATRVEIVFSRDEIRLTDDGHGMTFEAFRDFWMRVGSTHKANLEVSPGFGRPLTGSKGVGRLAAQFLATELELRTSSSENTESNLEARVDWDQAITAGDLQTASALYEERTRSSSFAGGSAHGTEIVLKRLRQEWTVETFRALAREIWSLQPPFGAAGPNAFDVDLTYPASPVAVAAFDSQMRAVLELWDAKIIGRLELDNGTARVRLSLQYREGPDSRVRYQLRGLLLHALEFEIRVFDLRNRQPYGIRVDDARAYLRDFGGVNVYDAGFRLPYYGPDSDWLHIEMDHSHRLSRSKLLPDDLQRASGLNFLPTNSRLYGVVRVNTAQERRVAEASGSGDYLALQVSRDRLVDNDAFQSLRDAVRWALDYYAVREAERSAAARAATRPVLPQRAAVGQLSDQLREFRKEIAPSAYAALSSTVSEIRTAIDRGPDRVTRQIAVLGALATAGASAIAFEHEIDKQLSTMDAIADQLQKLAAAEGGNPEVIHLEAEVRAWLERARGTRDLFAYVAQPENREATNRLLAKATVDEIVRQARVLLRRVTVTTDDVDPDLYLPRGSFAEWTAVFQNGLTNAATAVQNSTERIISVRSMASGARRRILIEDTGTGVDPDRAEEFFEPFVRQSRVSARARVAGLAGMGLGLTIARMVATELGCQLRFVPASAPYQTTLELSWSELS